MTEGDDSELDAVREQRREERIDELSGDGGSESAETPVQIDGTDAFDEAIAANDVVLVDFYADWCGPCKMVAPIVEELAEETDATVLKVDVDANQQLAGRYSVQSIPTLLFFADGELAERQVGAADKGTLSGTLDQLLAA